MNIQIIFNTVIKECYNIQYWLNKKKSNITQYSKDKGEFSFRKTFLI